MIAFGPVPSRRLGYSLGINHIPPKYCPYSCIYCQVGRTTHMELTRRFFYPLDQILREVERKITDSTQIGAVIDYLSLVPDGEPTLDNNLGKLIEELKVFGIPIAVISNSTLIDHDGVQADWVSLKLDAVEEVEWRQINRPHRLLSLSSILSGALKFRSRFNGKLVTETMLISGINDKEESINTLSAYLLELQPMKSYLSIPTRPPAESWVAPPSLETIKRIIQTISKRVPFIDLLIEAESPDFISSGNVEEDILGVIAVHPLREQALRNMIVQSGACWSVVENLLASRKIKRVQYRGEWFYINSSITSFTNENGGLICSAT